MPRLLLVDDDIKLCATLCEGLHARGHKCTAVQDAAAARAALESSIPVDLVLLDITLPGKSGWSVLESMREKGDERPVIFLTAHDTSAERIRGLELGADDYIAKPFEFEELVARIRAVLRRHKPALIYSFGEDLRIDLTARVVSRESRNLELSEREFDVIEALILAEGSVLSRADLLERVWDIRGASSTNIVDVIVMRARRKLDAGGGNAIRTVMGKGYCIEGKRIQ